MKKAILLFGVIVLIMSMHISSAVMFDNTSITFRFDASDVSSTKLVLEVQNAPEGDYAFGILDKNGEIAAFTSESSGLYALETASNFIFANDNYSLVLLADEDSSQVISTLRTTFLAPKMYSHMIHVYARWTAGQPAPPDSRGLGQGALSDGLLVNDSLMSTIATVDEAKALGESLLNTLLGSASNGDLIDFDGNGTAVDLSDGFGMIEYSYGMRDHINNAGNSDDAPANVTAKAQEVNGVLNDNIFDSGSFASFLTNLNSSDTILAQMYQTAFNLTQVSNATYANTLRLALQAHSTSFLDTMFTQFNAFRDLVVGYSFSFSAEIDLETTTPTSTPTTTDDEPASFPVLASLMAVGLFAVKKTRRS